jgi:translation initiation factor 2B subunit (eIF-2B alpha/beta/delta family)
MTQIPPTKSDTDARQFILKSIDDFVHEKFIMASRVLGEEACKKIDDGDAIMTYGMSAVVLNILLLAHSVRLDR